MQFIRWIIDRFRSTPSADELRDPDSDWRTDGEFQAYNIIEYKGDPVAIVYYTAEMYTNDPWGEVLLVERTDVERIDATDRAGTDDPTELVDDVEQKEDLSEIRRDSDVEVVWADG